LARTFAPTASRSVDPKVGGRWAALPAAEPDSTVRAHFTAELLMNRYGVLTRNAATAEGLPGGFATLYKVLTALEEAGRCQRGYFVESLGGAQFAVSATVDRLRGYADALDSPQHSPRPSARPQQSVTDALVLAAADPANPYGTTLPWPARPDADTGHRPGRKAGALVALVDGALVWYLERGGRSLLTFGAGDDAQRAAAAALADLVSARRLAGVLVEKIDGTGALEATTAESGTDGNRRVTADALQALGFARTPRGLRLR
jgi:ATP-dependent Lhr-like helicase